MAMANITVQCTTCTKNFLIIEKEQQFLQEKNLPHPKNCPSCRQRRRLTLRGERVLFKSACAKCGKTIIVTFNPATISNSILCREDYQKYFIENDPLITDPLPEN